MKEQHIFSKNSTYQLIEVLKTNRNKRYRQNCFLVEGVRSLNEVSIHDIGKSKYSGHR